MFRRVMFDKVKVRSFVKYIIKKFMKVCIFKKQTFVQYLNPNPKAMKIEDLNSNFSKF